MFFISLLRKFAIVDPYLKYLFYFLSSLFLFVEVGYGSKTAATSIRGDDKPPKLNKIQKLMWEGFKKTIIISIYIIPLHYLFYKAKTSLFIESPLCLIYSALFIGIYIILILGLINRYHYNGSFFKAFDYMEIFNLLKRIKVKNLLFVLICAMLAQSFTIQCFIDLENGFNALELVYTILTFFLAPWMLITTKRLIALNVRDLLNAMEN